MSLLKPEPLDVYSFTARREHFRDPYFQKDVMRQLDMHQHPDQKVLLLQNIQARDWERMENRSQRAAHLRQRSGNVTPHPFNQKMVHFHDDSY